MEYLEDGFHEDDIEGFELIQKFPMSVQNGSCANGLLLKVNQIGSVSEAIKAAEYAAEHNIDVTVSLRSGKTADDFIADLAVAVGARQIKLGSPVRLERNVKYNRLLKIAAEIEK